MFEALLDYDPVTRIKRTYYYDPYEGQHYIVTEHDVEPILEYNKTLYNESEGWKGDWHHVAQIPMPLYYDLKQKGIVDDPERLRAWLNDPDNRLFRTKPGKV